MVDLCNTQKARNYETPEVNEYEFHLSGIIDMLEKLQKKLDAELHDAQEDEGNAANASSMIAQDLTKLVELLSTQFAGNLLDLCAVEKWDRNTRSKPSIDFGTPLGRDEHTHDRQATVRRALMAVKPPYGSEEERLEKKFTPQGSETILKDLDSITKYNASQLVDNMDKNKVLKQILIKEKFDVKVEVEEENDNIIELNEISLSFNEGMFNMKECDAMITETNDKKFYIIFAQDVT